MTAGLTRRRRVPVFWLLIALLTLPSVGYAQEATITGTVTDATGGVLPGVTVTAVHEAIGITFEAVTDDRGVFRMPARIGTYRLTAMLSGFGTVTRAGLPVLVGQTVTVGLQLAPAGVAESVTVTGEAPLINVSTSSLGTNISQAQMEELPINGRNWQNLAMLAIGNRANDNTESEIAHVGPAGSYQVNIDGQQVTYYGGGLGDVQARYSRDAIAEFEFISNRFDATQGRSQGIQINAVTRGGTNRPSGLFGGYFRDSKLNAPDAIVHRKLPYSNQQLSGAFGGPIIRDKFHYFVNYEWEREPGTMAWSMPAWPSFEVDLTDERRERKGGARLDYQFTPAIRASLRGAIWDNDQPLDLRFGPSQTIHPSRTLHSHRDSDQLLLTTTQVLSNRAVNEIKVGWVGLRNQETSNVNWKNHPAANTDGITDGSPIIQFRGLRIGPEGSVPQEIQQGNLSLRDDFTLSFNKGGRHDMKFGGEYIKNSWWLLICRICSGTIDAQGGPIPANLEQLFPVWNDASTWNLAALNPIVRRYQLGIGDFTFAVDRQVMAAWVQDDWRIGSNLTLNLGLRYDAALNAFGEEYDFQPWVTGGRPNDLNNFGPRLGFAYKLNDRTVLRGGVGKFFAEVTDQSAHGTESWRNIVAVDLLPDGRPDFVTNPFNGPQPTYDQLVAQTCFANGNKPGCIRRTIGNNLADPAAQFPYSWQTSMGFQRQIGSTMAFEADYVYYGSFYNIGGGNINQAYDAKTGLPYAFSQVNRLPYPEWGTVSMRRHSLGMDEQNHALQTGFTKRFSDRWQASATYSLALGYRKDYPPVLVGYGCSEAISWTADFSRWVCDVPVNFSQLGVFEETWYRTGDQTHRASFNGIYEMPYGFQLSGLYFYGDNGKASVTSGVDVYGVGGAIADRTRADRSIIPRFGFNKKDLHRVDLRVSRRINLGGQASVEPILEVFNLFNRANITDWVTNESNPSFGQPTAATGLGYAPRVIQLGFKARF